ncbi:hypothetical protein ES705_04860 [subsurface metagenome]
MAKECKYREGTVCTKAGKEIGLLTCEKNCPVPTDQCNYLEIEKIQPVETLGEDLMGILVQAVCKKEEHAREIHKDEIKTCTKKRYAEECVRKK